MLVPVTGLTLAAIGGRGTPWGPFLGAATIAVLAMTEIALAQVRRWIDSAHAQVHQHLAVVRAEQAGLVDQRARFSAEVAQWQQQHDLRIDDLVDLLDTARIELSHAKEATAAASSELAELSSEWNALVQEAMQMGADVFNRRTPGPPRVHP